MKINCGKTSIKIFATGLALAALICGGIPIMAKDANPKKGNDKAPRGSPDYYPSPENPVGWRGDGSGKYPAANPPLRWSRAATMMKLLRSQADKPKEGDMGKPIPDGVIRDWLILGPVPVTNDLKKLDPAGDLLPDEAKMEPKEGDKIGDLAWKKYSPDTQTIVFRDIFGRQTQSVVYACAYVYSETNQAFIMMHIMSSGRRLLVNGAPPKVAIIPPHMGSQVTLAKGWNRILFRVQSDVIYGIDLWYLRCMLYSEPDRPDVTKYENENITWTTPLPGWGISAPVIVGDKIFLTTDVRTLACLNKSDGRLLWMRTTTFYDTATEEEKKANPEVFKEVSDLAAKLAEIDRFIKPDGTISNELVTAKRTIESKIDALMLKVDSKKYARSSSGEAGYCAPTPASDGRHVYVAYPAYLAACFDLEGKPRWTYMHAGTPMREHCATSSPLLLDSKLVVHFNRLFALDCVTGKPVWQMPLEEDYNPNQKHYTSANGYGYFTSLLALTLDKEPLIVTPPDVVRARDGVPLSFFALPGGAQNPIPTPVIGDGKIFRLWTKVPGTRGMTKMETIRLPLSAAEPFKAELLKGIVLDSRNFPCWYEGWYAASPLYHEGLLYCLSEDGVLSVVDTEKQELVYQKLLDLDLHMFHGGGPARGGAGSSLALAGNYIYFFGNHATCVVIKPGRKFEQVARNRIETKWDNGRAGHPEQTLSCPVFEGKRFYLRGIDNLYCIEDK